MVLAMSGALSVAQPLQTVVPSATAGFAVMQNPRAGNCLACHSVPDAAGKTVGTQSTFAPPLRGVGSRYPSEILRAWVVDARQINPQTLMPPFGIDLDNGRLFNDAQIADVLAALASLQ